MATSPFEIIAGPATVFVAPVATAFPAINATPPAAWVSLGRTDGGVTVTHNQSLTQIRTDQDLGPIKVIRTEEELHIEFSLADITLENYARVLNNVTVITVAPGTGTPGTKRIPLRQGLHVARVALLVRGPSPYMDANLQFEIPIAVQSSEPAPAFVKDDKVVLEVNYLAIEDPSAPSPGERFGRLVAQHAAPL